MKITKKSIRFALALLVTAGVAQAQLKVPQQMMLMRGGGGESVPDGATMVLYTDCNFKGSSYVVKAGDERGGIDRTRILAKSKYFIEETSSIMVKPGPYIVKLYKKLDYSDTPLKLIGKSADCLNNIYNDKIMAISVEANVMFYKDAAFNNLMFYSHGTDGAVNMPDVKGESANDQISSVRIPKGWTLMLYEHANGKGHKVILKGDISNLEGLNFNDMASSFIIKNPDLKTFD